jgi:hypothetical protein
VPFDWPAGQHWYIGYADTNLLYPAVDADSFAWTKSTTVDGGPWIIEASCTGEPFPGEVIPSAAVSGSGATPTMEFSPNPFNATTAISYELRAASHISLKVYDAAGRLVRVLTDGWREAGMHEVTFDGVELATGVYLMKLQAGDYEAVQKMVLVK